MNFLKPQGSLSVASLTLFLSGLDLKKEKHLITYADSEASHLLSFISVQLETSTALRPYASDPTFSFSYQSRAM